MKPNKTIWAVFLVGVMALLVIAWNPSNLSFNPTQFNATEPYISISSGVLLTNANLESPTMDNAFATNFTASSASITGAVFYAGITLVGAGNSSNWIGGDLTMTGTNYGNRGYFTNGVNSADTATSATTATTATYVSTTPFTNAINTPGSVESASLFIRTNLSGGALSAGLFYVSNLTGDITLAEPTGVPADTLWSIKVLFLATGADRKVTFPGGVMGDPGDATPPVNYVTNNAKAWCEIAGYGQQATNRFWRNTQ